MIFLKLYKVTVSARSYENGKVTFVESKLPFSGTKLLVFSESNRFDKSYRFGSLVGGLFRPKNGHLKTI